MPNPFDELVYSSPTALAALSRINSYGGQSEPLSMAQAVLATEQYKKGQQQQQIQQALPALLQQVDLNDVNGSVSKLAPVVGLEGAIKLVKLKQDSMQESRLGQNQELLAQLLGVGAPASRNDMTSPEDSMPQTAAPGPAQTASSGTGLDLDRANNLVKLGVISNDPRMMQAGQYFGEQQFKRTNESNDRFTKLDDQYQKRIEPYVGAIEDYNASLDLAAQDAGAADYQLVKLGVQAFDKRASAVTDDEFNNMQRTGSLNQQMQRIIGNYTTGAKLTQDQRAELINAIRTRAEQNRGKIDKLNTAFEKKAKAAGISFDTIREGYDPGIVRGMDEVFGGAPQFSNPQDLDKLSVDDLMKLRKKFGGK